MEHYDSEAFRQINWDTGYVLVEGQPVEIPRYPYSSTHTNPNFFVRYFEENEIWDDYVNEFFDRMNTPNDKIRELLSSDEFCRVVSSLFHETDEFLSRKDLARFVGYNPSDNIMEELEDRKMLDVQSREDGDWYKLRKDSDAYWLFEIGNEIRRNSDQKSVLDEMVHVDSEAEFLSLFDTNATSMDQFLSQWLD